MRYSILFTLIGFYLCAFPFFFWESNLSYILLWPGLAFIIVGLAYGTNRPSVFGKTQSGRLGPFNTILLLPYLLMVWSFWHLLRLVKTENAHDQITPTLTIGRRIYPRELPTEVDAVVDLTAEHPEPKGVREAGTYVAKPILDNHVPSVDELEALIEKVHDLGHLYVHCAEGHGRAALISACVLLKRGDAHTPEEAVEMLQKERPLVRPRGQQMGTLRKYADRLKARVTMG